LELKQRDEMLLNKMQEVFSAGQAAKSDERAANSKNSSKPPVAFVKTEKNSLPPLPPSDEEDNVSQASSTSDVEFIRVINKASFSNKDTHKKLDLDRLIKIQKSWHTAIPILAYDKPDKPDDKGHEEARPHNYVRWITALLKYFSCLSPQLATSTKLFLNQIDVDKYLHGKGKVEYPVLSEDDYTDLMKLSAMSTIASKVSSDFEHLVDDEALTDIFPSLLNIHMCCNPNSAEDRTDQMGELFNMKMQNETVIKFGQRIKKASININNQFGTSVVTNDMLVSVLKIGVAQGSKSKAYEDALKHLKFIQHTYPFQAMVNLLHHQRDRTYDTSTAKEDPAHSASMAITRGGKGGGRDRGRGRGGRGRGRGKGGKGRDSDDSGRSYYMNTSPSGEDVVTEPVNAKKKLSAPCFTHITKADSGGCTNPNCPFNHEFTLIDTRKSSTTRRRANNNESKYDTADDNADSSSAATSSGANTTTQQTGNVNSYGRRNVSSSGHGRKDPVTTDDDDDDGFNYYHDLGFKTSSVQQQIPFDADHMDFVSLFLLVFNFISALASKFILSCRYLIFFITSFFVVLKLLVDKLFAGCVKTAHFCSAVAPFLRAAYQIILDCGCTWSMSGDFGLFLPESLVPISEAVGLAESGYAAEATHYGKLCIQGKFIDALYVPKFKQTMISLGQMEKLGLRYQEVNNFRDLVTPSGSIFLSFTLLQSNLYELNDRALHSNSATSASSSSSSSSSTSERSA
jgi:hypothetical protein